MKKQMKLSNDDKEYLIKLPYGMKRAFILAMVGIFVIWGLMIFGQMRIDYNANPEIFEIRNNTRQNEMSIPGTLMDRTIGDSNISLNWSSTDYIINVDKTDDCFCQSEAFFHYIIYNWFYGMLSDWITFFGFILILKFILFFKPGSLKKALSNDKNKKIKVSIE